MSNEVCSLTNFFFVSDTYTIGAYCVKKLEPYSYRKAGIPAKIVHTNAINEIEKRSKHGLIVVKSYINGNEKY